jgi:hypothetical protein
MKKFLIFTFSIFIAFHIYGQQVTIVCPPFVNCTNPDPMDQTGYLANVTGDNALLQAGFSKSFQWTATPGTVTNEIGKTTSTYSCMWLNTINSPVKSLTVVVKFEKQGQNTVTIQAQMNVTVKYLAPFTSLIFTGGNVSQTNPANNGTITIPCNAGTISLAANQTSPITDPSQTVAYTWTLPNGVTQTSSTGSMSFNGTGTADGAIVVQAKRMDGNFIQTFTVNYVRNRVTEPTITQFLGGSLCANSGLKGFSSTSTNATIFNWSSSGTFNITGTGGANNSVAAVNVNGSGYGYITVTADNACSSPQSKSFNFTTGTPVLTSVSVDGYPNSYINYINNPAYLVANISNNGPGTSPSFNWTIDGGNGSLYPNSGGSGITYNGVSYNHGNAASAYAYDFVRIKVATANVCGEGGTAYMNLQDMYSMYRMASPNPAQNQIAVDLSKNAPVDMLKSITLVSDIGTSVVRTYTQGGSSDRFSQRRDNRVTLDVSNLPRGKYFLVLLFVGNKKFSEQIVLN